MVGSITKLNLNNNSRKKGCFARMVVYVSLNKPLISKVLINGKPQRVEYEFLSLVCFECGRYGYMKKTCLNGLLERNAKMEAPQIVSKLEESKTAHKGSDVGATDASKAKDKDMEEFDLKNREQEAPKIKDAAGPSGKWHELGLGCVGYFDPNEQMKVTFEKGIEPAWIFSYLFWSVRLALNYHGTFGKPVVSRIALLDSRYKRYQDACIGTVEATLSSGMAMIIGDEMVESTVTVTLHYQIVYRVQDHAFKLSNQGSEDSLLISVNTKEEPHCVHVPKQIPKQELLNLLPEKWVTNYEQIHQHDQLIRSTKSQIITRADGTSEIKFDHSHLKQLPTPPIFSTQMMLQPLQPDDPDDCFEDLDEEIRKSRRLKNHRKSTQSKFFERWIKGDPDIGLLGEDNGKFVYLVDYSAGKPKPQPPKVQNQSPTDLSQPPKKDPNDQQWLAKPLKQPSAEATLNWQIENALAQNSALKKIDLKVNKIDTNVSNIKDKTNENSEMIKNLIKLFKKRLKEVATKTTAPRQDFFSHIAQREKEIQNLKEQIKTLEEIGKIPSPQPLNNGIDLFPSIRQLDKPRSSGKLKIDFPPPEEKKKPSTYDLFLQIRAKKKAEKKKATKVKRQKKSLGKRPDEKEEEEQESPYSSPPRQISKSLMIQKGKQSCKTVASEEQPEFLKSSRQREPKTTGKKADDVIAKLGFHFSYRVEAIGFLRGPSFTWHKGGTFERLGREIANDA
ncbi:hypothetical protein Gotri_014802 [Gossypium trilobum]|uniref:CCHC-type domain-containing protein n=1 Tax=Gossypium trilobum TaxID=34281 RepID=A0A7J9DXY4_9ROSI|nr:hypothetical protein [Gossypium trilobum]